MLKNRWQIVNLLEEGLPIRKIAGSIKVGSDTVEVKSTNGDTHLGGDDFDQKIIEYLVSEFKTRDMDCIRSWKTTKKSELCSFRSRNNA